MHEALAGDAADVRARAAVHALRAFDHHDAAAERGHPRGDCLAALAEPDHQEVDMHGHTA
jgi:hypothetical protein